MSGSPSGISAGALDGEITGSVSSFQVLAAVFASPTLVFTPWSSTSNAAWAAELRKKQEITITAPIRDTNRIVLSQDVQHTQVHTEQELIYGTTQGEQEQTQ